MKKFLCFMCTVYVFNEGVSMDPERLISNPINAIVKRYNAVTPDNAMESFKKSVKELKNKLKEKYDLYSQHKILAQKWKSGIDILDKVCVVNNNVSEREEIYNLVLDITDNGFFDISNAAIIVEPNLISLKPVFDYFWQLLLQAKKITAWWMCSADSIIPENAPYLCFEAIELLNNPDIDNIFWAISIMGNVPQAIEELSEDNEPSEDQILNAKKSAEKTLEQVFAEVPNLKNCLLK